MRQATPLDNLRPGLLLDGRYKLKERIPRWVASRRFLAEARSERLQVLFFAPDQAPVEATAEWLSFLEQTEDSFWLKPVFQGQGAGFVYLGLPLVRGPSLRQMLDEGKPWFCEDAARFLRRLVLSLMPLAEARVELPAISADTILVGREGRNFTPGIFPLPLPGFVPEASGNLPQVLRALLYELLARRPAPVFFDEEALTALPAPARNKWSRVFTEVPTLEQLADLPLTTHVPLPGATQRLSPEVEPPEESPPVEGEVPLKIPPPRYGGSRRLPAGPSNEPQREIRVPTENSRSRFSRSRRGGARRAKWSVPGVFSSLAGMVAVAAVVWFSWHLVASLLHAEHLWTADSISSMAGAEFPDEVSPLANAVPGFEEDFSDVSTASLHTAPEPAPAPKVTQPPPPALVSAESSPASSMTFSLTSPPPAIEAGSLEGGLSTPPEDLSLPREEAGKIGSSLLSWQTRWEQEKENPQIVRAFERYLQGLAPQIDSMRSGRLPQVLEDLEKVAEGGFPAARYLLGQVLWGRDSRRSEDIMTTLAREDYAPARVWCLDRNIAWD